MYKRTIRTGKWLQCGCCGEDFQIWDGYKDQDQDNGFGICASCQGDIDARNEQEFDKAIEVLRSGLNETNRAKFDAMDRDLQKAVVWKALDDGVLKFEIRRAS